MKNLSFGLLLVCGVLLSKAVLAEELLNGCEMNEWSDSTGNPGYQVISKDNAGVLRTVYWFKKAEADAYDQFGNLGNYDRNLNVRPYFSHGKLDPEKTSEAVYACEIKHQHLPVRQEFEALRNCFEVDKKSPNFLSSKGIADLVEKFPDMANQWFWSSTRVPGSPNGVAFFDGGKGEVRSFWRNVPNAVRCVIR